MFVFLAFTLFSVTACGFFNSGPVGENLPPVLSSPQAITATPVPPTPTPEVTAEQLTLEFDGIYEYSIVGGGIDKDLAINACDQIKDFYRIIVIESKADDSEKLVVQPMTKIGFMETKIIRTLRDGKPIGSDQFNFGVEIKELLDTGFYDEPTIIVNCSGLLGILGQ